MNGAYQLLDRHQKRLDLTFRKRFPDKSSFRLDHILPKITGSHKQKVRLEYDDHSHHIEVQDYQPKKIESMKMIVDNKIDYSLKYADRSALNRLLEQVKLTEEIIIVKNGHVTDCSYANLVFWAEGIWYTPKTCLLNGVKRQELLAKGQLREIDMPLEKLKDFQKVGIINAMNDLEDMVIDISRVL